MASFTSAAFSPDVAASVLKLAREQSADLLRRKNAFLQKQESVHGKGKPMLDGAPLWSYPMTVREHSVPTRLLTGYEVVNHDVVDTDDVMQFTPMYLAQPAALSIVEKQQSDMGKLNLMKKRQSVVLEQMMRGLNRRLLTGESFDNGAFDGLSHLEGVNSTGFLEDAAIGSQVNSIGGLSKATYNTLTGMQNQVQNALASASTNGLHMLFRLISDIAVFSGDKTALCAYVSLTYDQNLFRLVQPQEQYIKIGDRDILGMPVKVFGGVDLVVDSRMPVAGTHTVPVSAYVVDHSSVKMVYAKGGHFEELEETRLSQQLVWSRPLFLSGQLVAEDGVGTSGVLVNAETY